MRVLGAGESSPAITLEGGAGARMLIVCDHAGREVPVALGDLGLPLAAFETHIAWDIGAAEVSTRLGRTMDAPVILQRYSRLVIDCNREPRSAEAIPSLVDGWSIPANRDLPPDAVEARIEQIHRPYHEAIAAGLDMLVARGPAPVLVMVHSFTPTMAGQARPWLFGVIHDGRSALSRAVLDGLRRSQGGPVGDNLPYAMDGTDFTAPHHALARGLDYLELEIRQDLVAEPEGCGRVAALLQTVLAEALQGA